ncbi:MAG: diacylglycerol kinase family protein [Bacteroidales bacterium]|nr:diacylglycerol kinase family protein [Bacteroidales bacterium]
MSDKFSDKELFSSKKRIRSFDYAFHGIYNMLRSQHNFWIQISIAILAVVMGFALEISRGEWMILTLTIGMVLAAETFNSAIEALTDLVQQEYDPKAGWVKDLAAGAVLITAIASIVVGILIFLPRILALL